MATRHDRKRLVLAGAALLALCTTTSPAALAEPGPDVEDAHAGAEMPTDSRGLWRDTKYFLSYQFGAIAILYAMPEDVTGWTPEQKQGYDLSIWWDNTSHPQPDTDDFYINYILHPYWGAAYFVRARERGFNEWQAFGYSALLSSLYEFGVEALFENPSTQDLWVTPVVGSMLGMYFVHLRGDIRDRDAERGYRSTGDKWLWVLTDPLGSLNRQFDKWFNWDSEVELRPYRMQIDSASIDAVEAKNSADGDYAYGLQLQVRW